MELAVAVVGIQLGQASGLDTEVVTVDPSSLRAKQLASVDYTVEEESRRTLLGVRVALPCHK